MLMNFNSKLCGSRQLTFGLCKTLIIVDNLINLASFTKQHHTKRPVISISSAFHNMPLIYVSRMKKFRKFYNVPFKVNFTTFLADIFLTSRAIFR